MKAQNKRQRLHEKRKKLREWLEFFLYLLSALIIAGLLRMYVYEFVQVKGDSMNPTLLNGEFVFVEKINAHEPKRGEILIVKYPEDENYYIKRLVGMPGDIVSVENGRLMINGIAQEEAYIAEEIDYDLSERLVPENMYFVLGDNRNNSQDSHSGSIGMIPAERIIGHAVFVVWPFSEIKGL